MQRWQEPYRSPNSDETIVDNDQDITFLVLKWFFFVTIVAMSFVDAVLTYAGFMLGILVEANPLMLFFLAWPNVFFIVKIGLTVVGLLIILSVKSERVSSLIIPALIFIFIVYSIILGIHINGWMDVYSSEFSFQESL